MKIRRGFTLIEVLIVVMVISIVAALAIPNILRSKLTANESAAQTTLKTIAVACENYATANNGLYPASETQLLEAEPPYLNGSYDGQTIQGYKYTFNLTNASYLVIASPASCGANGSKTYTIVTGGILTGADCGA